MKLKPSEFPLLAVCRVGLKPCPLYVNRWDTGQSEKIRTNVSVVIVNYYQADLCHRVYFIKFTLSSLLNAIKRQDVTSRLTAVSTIDCM